MRPVHTQSGAISRKFVVILGAVAATIALADVSIVLWLGSMSLEERVALIAEDENILAGEIAEEITRFDGAVAAGTTLIKRFTNVDTCREGLSPVVREHLEPDAALDDLAPLAGQATLAEACALHQSPGNDATTVRFEYRDERKKPLAVAAATASTC